MTHFLETGNCGYSAVPYFFNSSLEKQKEKIWTQMTGGRN
jgi:hypothetical protein